MVNAGYNPIIIDNFSNSEPFVVKNIEKIVNQPITNYIFDYSDLKKTKDVLEKESIDGIIHFAAFKQVGESVKFPLKFYKNNVLGLIKLLELIESERKVKHFVFSSSCTVYGNPDILPVTETTEFKRAASPYGASKQMDEIIINDVVKVSSKLNSIALRYFNPIGAHPSALIGELPKGVPANLVPFITQTVAGIRDCLTVFGNDYPTKDGTCIRDYIHVVDLAKAHVKAISYLENKPSGVHEALNIGTGKGSSVLELINCFESVTKQKLKYKIGPRRQGDIISTYSSATKANKLLGWKAEKTLGDALNDAWNWQQTLR